MGWYNVVQVPCVVGKLHHVRPTLQPVEVDDEAAAPLVESGHLQPYKAGWRTVVGTYNGEPTEFTVDDRTTAILDGLPPDVAEKALTIEAQPADEGTDLAQGLEESAAGERVSSDWIAEPDADENPEPEPAPEPRPRPRRPRRRSED